MPQESPTIISIRQRLKNTADALHITLNDTLRLYFLEGFLRRLAQATCAEHHTPLTMSGAVFSSSDFLVDSVQEANWARFLAQMSHFPHTVLSFAEAIQLVRDLYSPVINDTVRGKTWSHLSHQWQ